MPYVLLLLMHTPPTSRSFLADIDLAGTTLSTAHEIGKLRTNYYAIIFIAVTLSIGWQPIHSQITEENVCPHIHCQAECAAGVRLACSRTLLQAIEVECKGITRYNNI